MKDDIDDIDDAVHKDDTNIDDASDMYDTDDTDEAFHKDNAVHKGDTTPMI